MTGSSVFEVANDESADLKGVKFKKTREFNSSKGRPKGGKKNFKGEKKGRKTPGKTTPRRPKKPKNKNSYAKNR